ncbi:uncharacterized, partial [Tachysurus ichikawai]
MCNTQNESQRELLYLCARLLPHQHSSPLSFDTLPSSLFRLASSTSPCRPLT